MSDKKLVLLPSAEHQVDEELVKILETFLEEVKAGKVDGVALVAIASDGSTSMVWGGMANLTVVGGAAHELATAVTLAALSTIQSS